MHHLKIKTDKGDIDLPYLEFKGKRKGKTCIISGGMHGDEINGIELVKRFLDHCMTTKIEKSLRGKLIVLPILNQSGFERITRTVAHDNKDLNRSFGKKEKTTTNMIANELVKHFYSKADLGIDCHDSGKRSVLIPHARIHSHKKKLCHECTRDMGFAFGSKIIVERPGKRGMLAVEMAKKYDLPVITVEIGGGLKIMSELLKEGLDGIINILKYHQMLPGNPKKPDKQFFLKDRFGIVAPDTGIVMFNVKLGDRVHVDDKIGTLYIPRKNEEIDLIAPMCGIIFSRQYIGTAMKSKVLYSILEDKKCHMSKRKTKGMFEEVVNISM